VPVPAGSPARNAREVAAEDADAAAEALADEHGLRVEPPPEEWLFKVCTDDAMVDVVLKDSGMPAERAVVQNAREIEVLSVRMPVLSATEVLAQQLKPWTSTCVTSRAYWRPSYPRW
jgi:hypothetical protein